jgi:hypothetical protein
MRRTDNARILDSSKHNFEHRGTWAHAPVYVRRAATQPENGGAVEYQQRLMVGRLPVAYRCVLRFMQLLKTVLQTGSF